MDGQVSRIRVDTMDCSAGSNTPEGSRTVVRSLLQEDLKLRQVEEKLMSRRTKSSSDISRIEEQ